MLFFQRLARSAVIVPATLAFSFAGMLAAGAQQQTVGVVVNGSQVNLYPAPVEQGGRVFVPLRGVFERLGATVVYSNGTIDATGANGQEIQLTIGSTQATVNGQAETIDVAPFLIGARTFVPLRFISEALGASVNWDPSDDTVSISTGSAPQAYSAPQANYAQYADVAPPPLPVYDQPPVPEPNYIWQPGYWALGPYGYYWVPGTWVPAPRPGYLWTPPYWSFEGGGFHFISGFWATAVGFYGGINYGGGYFGNGYGGGHWSGNDFAYNRAVTNVNTTVINNTYIDKTVVNNYYGGAATHTSYVGANGGIQAHPNARELEVAKAPHLGLTPIQQQHISAAASNRLLLATVNHNSPPVLSVAKPLTPTAPVSHFAPITPVDKAKLEAPAAAATPYRAPAAPAAPAYHAPAVTPVPYHAPVAPAAPVYHAPVRTPVPYHAPAVPAAPVYHAPIHTPVPVAPAHPPATLYHAPARTPIPYHAPPLHPQTVHPPVPQAHAPAPKPHPVPLESKHPGDEKTDH